MHMDFKSCVFYGFWIPLSLEKCHLNGPNDPYYTHTNFSLKYMCIK